MAKLQKIEKKTKKTEVRFFLESVICLKTVKAEIIFLL